MKKKPEWVTKWWHRSQTLRVPLGFVVAGLFVLLAQPTPVSIAIGCSLGLVGLVWRAWAAGHLRKDEVLTVRGPYRLARNPLYWGSAWMTLGCLTAGAPWPLALFVVGLFVGIYWPVMQAEAAHLAKLFPDIYPTYAAQTPLFLPDLRRLTLAWRDGFDWRLYARHREYWAGLGLAVVFVVLAIKLWWFG
ncbi:MAG: methyltransferase family protein [Acidobacteriota bacterium]